MLINCSFLKLFQNAAFYVDRLFLLRIICGVAVYLVFVLSRAIVFVRVLVVVILLLLRFVNFVPFNPFFFNGSYCRTNCNDIVALCYDCCFDLQ